MSEYQAAPNVMVPVGESGDRARDRMYSLHRMTYSFPQWRRDDRGKVYVSVPGWPNEVDIPLGGLVVASNIEYDTSQPLVVTVEAPIVTEKAASDGEGTDETT